MADLVIAERSEAEPTDARPFLVLALDGGGSKGTYTLGVLREVEALFGKPLSTVFDLVFGSSTGSIIGSLLALGHSVPQIEDLYFDLIPKVMRHHRPERRTAALKQEAQRIFGERDFSSFTVDVGIVATNYEYERPTIFKSTARQAHGMSQTFAPGFGCTIAEAVVASCAAFPFFEMQRVRTKNQQELLLLDGGYVANNPALFALADAWRSLKVDSSRIRLLSVGVGNYNEPKRSWWHQLQYRVGGKYILKMFNTSSTTVEQLRKVLFPQIRCVRISESYPQPEYATDFLDSDIQKLRKLHGLGRESFAKFEREVRALLDSDSASPAAP